MKEGEGEEETSENGVRRKIAAFIKTDIHEKEIETIEKGERSKGALPRERINFSPQPCVLFR